MPVAEWEAGSRRGEAQVRWEASTYPHPLFLVMPVRAGIRQCLYTPDYSRRSLLRAAHRAFDVLRAFVPLARE